MTPQELKMSILQLAIQGKLVEQRPEEGTGEELYREIQQEKQRLIASGKIKKEKPLPEIAEEEKPFEISESWVWVRLKEICTKIIDGDHNPPAGEPNQTEYLMLSAQNIGQKSLIDLEKVRYLTKEIFSKENERTKAQKGDIFFTIVGTLGRSCVYQGGYNLTFQRSVSVISTQVNNQYLKCVLDSGYIQNLMKREATGTAQKGFYLNQVERLKIPLPPLVEQKRIVAKIEKLLPFLDRYEQAWSHLETCNKCFPGDMKKSILQLAIQGKLVEQRPEEGTGEVFYQQIQTEKQRLIKTERIKNGKPLPEITETEKPFEIPESWKWVRLNDIISTLGDGIHGTPIFDDLGEYYFINGNNLVNGRIEIKSDTKKVSVIEYEKYKKPLGENTILLSINGTIGNIAFYAGEPVILGKSACYFSLLNGGLKEYICHLLHTDFFTTYAVREATQTTIKNVSLKAMRMLPVPLPPLAEQKRIVARLEELLPLCDRLK